ncbi:IS1096 element passenger TnpR family protein [Cupriavidus sp. YAF13]|uniref:IS1096 element passenger TnpR family protein n=1 Tax=Cupriavidus sp. YAF13 TaxID=3233075 RepID=UPI003F93431F
MASDPGAATSILQLRIALRGLSPPVWRRVLVPEHLTFPQLHNVIQVVMGYLDNNRQFIVNYGDRYRHGDPIASGFVESAVNQVVSKRFVKRQQMAWRPRHAHNLLQIRTAVLNDQLRSYVERWYPSIAGEGNHRLAA